MSPNTYSFHFLENNKIISLYCFKNSWLREHAYKHFIFLWPHTSELEFTNPVLQMNKLSPIYQISPVALIGEASETSIQVFCTQIHSLYFPQGQSTSFAHHTYWQLHVELVNYMLGFENCFGRPVIKETNQKYLFVPLHVHKDHSWGFLLSFGIPSQGFYNFEDPWDSGQLLQQYS